MRKSEKEREKIKIFIEVGSHQMPFERLFKEVDRLIESGALAAKVFAQIGYTKYSSKNFETKEFISESEMIEKIKWCDLVLCHGGAGNIISALSLHKPLVVVPRRSALGEHTDDHQTQLAKALEGEGKCISVYEINNLGAAIKKALKMKSNAQRERAALTKMIKDFIEAEQNRKGQQK